MIATITFELIAIITSINLILFRDKFQVTRNFSELVSDLDRLSATHSTLATPRINGVDSLR